MKEHSKLTFKEFVQIRSFKDDVFSFFLFEKFVQKLLDVRNLNDNKPDVIP